MKLERNADNIDLIACLNNGHSRIIFETDTSLVILDEDMPCIYIHCTDLNEANELIKSITVDENMPIVFHQKEMMKYFDAWKLDIACYNVAYFKDDINIIESPYKIRLLTEADLYQASMLYRKIPDNQYVLSRLKAKEVIGAFDQNQLIGMIGTHDEDSIGMLQIHPDYRRHHLASALESLMIKKQLDRKKTVYAQVEVRNIASLNLQKKLGMVQGERIIYWTRHYTKLMPE